MSYEKVENISAKELFLLLKKEKSKLIAERKILDKKDNYKYPIQDHPFNIPSNWEWSYLSDISIIQEGPGIRKHQYTNSGVQFLTVTNILEDFIDLEKSKKFISIEQYNNYSHFTINKGDIVTACSGGSWGKSAIFNLDEKLILNTSTLRLRFFNDIGDNKFLYYLTKTKYFKDNLSSYSTGQQPNYGYSHYSKIPIPIPPLSEQQRIVSIIDKCFTTIDQAKSNAEQNLKNAKELFESYLNGVFDNKGDDWEEKYLEDCFKMKSGDNLTAKNMSEGEYPVFGGNGIAGYHNDYNLSGSNVIIGRVGALCGNVRHITEHIWLTDNAFKIVDFKFEFDHSFLTYLLNHKELRSYARQAAQPVISNSSLKDVILHFPKSKEEQQAIVSQLDALRAETQKLEQQYKKKIEDLGELKKSILTKAFNGEL